jgi:hypothetical protein
MTTKIERETARAKLEAALAERIQRKPNEFVTDPHGTDRDRRRALIYFAMNHHGRLARNFPNTNGHERIARQFRRMLKTY